MTAEGEERFEIAFFTDGRQHWLTSDSLEVARQIRDSSLTATEARREQELAAAGLRRVAAQARVRDRADLTDAYSYIRRAAQCLDRAQASQTVRDAQSSLIRCEDLIAEAIREIR